MTHAALRPYAAAALVGAGLIAVTPVLHSPPSPPDVQTPAMTLSAGETLIFDPDTATFDITSADGAPPFYDVLEGTEDWDLTNPPLPGGSAVLTGVDTQTTIGPFTNDDFFETEFSGFNLGAAGFAELPDPGSQIDLLDFGGGFENEWINFIPDAGGAATITDMLITPFGDFTLF